jgi:hypothetical protein
LQLLPGALCFLAENNYVVLAIVEIKSEASFNVAAPGPIMSAGDVIDVDQKSATLGMGYVKEFHLVVTS